MPAWYQWATPPVAAMRPACVVPVQYFLCDRKAFALTVDDAIPAISVQTSTIVPPMQKGPPESSDKPFSILEIMAQFGYGVQRPFW
jgi:hypothetical protein